MSVAMRLRTQRATDVGAMYTARGLATTAGEAMQASYSNFIWNDRFNSQAYAERMARQKMFDPIIVDLEEKDPGFDRRNIYTESKKYFNQESEALGRRAFTTDEARYAYLAERSAAVGRDQPMPSFTDFFAEAARMGAADAAEVAAKADEVASLYGGRSTAKLRLAQMIGALPAAAQDPVIIGALVASWPVAATASIARMAAFEAAVGGFTELPIQLQRQNWYKTQGRELSGEEMAMAIGVSTAFGGIVGGVFGGVFKLAGGKSQPMFAAFKHGPQQAVNDLAEAHAQLGMRYIPPFEGDPAYFSNRVIRPAPPKPKPWEGVLVEDKWVEEAVNNVWTPTPAVLSLDRVITDATVDVVNPELRTTMLAAGSDANLNFTSNPAFRTDTLPVSYVDRMVWTHRNRILKQKNRANVQDAIIRLNRGESPNPQDMGELSLQIKLADDTRDISRAALKREATGDVSRLLKGSETPLTTKSSTVRSLVAGLVRRAYEQKVRPLIDDVADKFPEKGWYKPDLAKPKYTLKQLENRTAAIAERIAKIDDEIEVIKRSKALTQQQNAARVNKELKTLREELAEAQRVAADYQKYGAQPPVGPVQVPRAINDIIADMRKLTETAPNTAKLDAKLEKATARKATEEGKLQALEPYQQQLDAYSAKLLEADRVNQGLRAQRNLQALADGKIPEELKPMRDLVVKSLNDERTNRYWTTPESADYPDIMTLTDRQTRKSIAADQQSFNFNAVDTDVQKAADASAEARFADDVPAEVQAAVGYDDVIELDEAVSAARQCGAQI